MHKLSMNTFSTGSTPSNSNDISTSVYISNLNTDMPLFTSATTTLRLLAVIALPIPLTSNAHTITVNWLVVLHA